MMPGRGQGPLRGLQAPPFPDVFLAPWIKPSVAEPPALQATASHLGEILVLLMEAAEPGPPRRPSCLWCCVCCTRKRGLMSSEALSCPVLTTMVVLLPRMRKLRPEEEVPLALP